MRTKFLVFDRRDDDERYLGSAQSLDECYELAAAHSEARYPVFYHRERGGLWRECDYHVLGAHAFIAWASTGGQQLAMTPAQQNERQTMEHVIRHRDWQCPHDPTKRYVLFVATSGELPSGVQDVPILTTGRIVCRTGTANQDKSVLAITALLGVGENVTFHRWNRTANTIERFTWTGKAVSLERFSFSDGLLCNP